MMRSLFAGITGLKTHQTQMDVIGNNIANVNTIAYKKSTVTFRDQFYQTISPATAPGNNNGGTNTQQIGLGVGINSIVSRFTTGSSQYTGAPLDLAIGGDGFFIVKTIDGDRYTRAGNFTISSDGSLVDALGNFVRCVGATQNAADGTYSPTGAAVPPSTTTSYTLVDLKVDSTKVSNVSVNKAGAIIGIAQQDLTSADLQNVTLSGTVKKGETVVLGYVALTTFSNPEGLEKLSNNLYASTQNSGLPQTTTPGLDGSGALIPSNLEMSNVDLSEEMVNMIITQRGFQANSRIITTTDSMLEELVNLKR